jgi:hypothetical protein
MGWHKTAALGDSEIEVCFSRTGRFHRHLDRGDDLTAVKLRLSGRHLQLVMRRKAWDDLTEEERIARLRNRL